MDNEITILLADIVTDEQAEPLEDIFCDATITVGYDGATGACDLRGTFEFRRPFREMSGRLRYSNERWLHFPLDRLGIQDAVENYVREHIGKDR